MTTTRTLKRAKTSKKPDNLLQWQTWLEAELKPPLTEAVSTNLELRRVLKAFLTLLIQVRRSRD